MKEVKGEFPIRRVLTLIGIALLMAAALFYIHALKERDLPDQKDRPYRYFKADPI